MTTGARRGELCALRWSRIDLTPGRAVMGLRRAISRGEDGWVEGDLKTHQQRRVALDPDTVEVLTEHRDRCHARTQALGREFSADAFVFSGAPDGSTYLTPGSLTQRYDRLAERLAIDTTLHKLRHYSATELIAAGVDVRTVAGWLGHAGGGTTTLKTYTAWVSEADQRAPRGLGGVSVSPPAIESGRRRDTVRCVTQHQHQLDQNLPALAPPDASADERGRAIEARMVARYGAPSIQDYRRAYAACGAEWPGDEEIRRRHPVAPETAA